MGHFCTAQGIDLTVIGCAVKSNAAFHCTWAGSNTTNLVQSMITKLINLVSDVKFCWASHNQDYYNQCSLFFHQHG